MENGIKVHWRGINRTEEGVVEAKDGERYLIRTVDGKVVIVHRKSLIPTSVNEKEIIL